MLAAEQKAEIVVLYALGDLDGPLSGEIKLGVCKRRALDSQIKAMKASRSRALAHRVEVYMRGDGAGARLHSAVRDRLIDLGCHLVGPWFDAGAIVAGVVRECASLEGVSLLTIEEALDVEAAELEKLMDRVVE